VYVDRNLTTYETIWAAAGTPNTVFAITPAALVDASGGLIADLAVE
jgi:prolyl-tRNA editing enzyme YbaK/EbsC (Cys-tRNA(Pro) deacylase)